MLQSIITHHQQWQIVIDAISEKSTPQQTVLQTQGYIINQYHKILYHNHLPDEYKLEWLTECYYELMTMTDLLAQHQKPIHALSIITTSLSHIPEIDDFTQSEDEASHLIEYFGHSLNNLLKQSSLEETTQILELYQQFLTKLYPDNLYYDQLHELHTFF